MTREAVAVAHPNIALSKYWGKRDGGGELPRGAEPLGHPRRADDAHARALGRRACASDRFVLDGAARRRDEALARVVALLDARARARRA